MTYAVGIDIGGSAIKYAVVDAAGAIVWPPDGAAARVSYRVLRPGTAELTWHARGAVEEIACTSAAAADAETDAETDAAASGAPNLVEDQWVVPAAVAQAALQGALRHIHAACPHPVTALGIGATGLIGPDGVVKEGLAFWGYRGCDWAAVAAEAGPWPAICVLNDARAAAWAEYARTSAGQSSSPSSSPGAFLHVTAGTRVGGAIIAGGRFLEGADGCAGEFSYQQWLAPDGAYRPGARLCDGLAGDPTAFGAALTGILHMANPNQVVLCGFAPAFVAAVQAHLDRWAFAAHRRAIIAEAAAPSFAAEVTARTDAAPSIATASSAVARYGEQAGSLLYVARRAGRITSALLVQGKPISTQAALDFMAQWTVVGPSGVGEPGMPYFGEVAGSFGIEGAYAAQTGRRDSFAAIAAAAQAGNDGAANTLARASQITAGGIANACLMTGAHQVTVGGAVPLLYTPYLAIVAEHVAAHLKDSRLSPIIAASTAAGDAGVIGAALHALGPMPAAPIPTAR